jgi:LysM repeat protein
MASKEHLNQIRFLSISLFLSGAVNIILIAFFVFWAFYDRPLTPYMEPKPQIQKDSLAALAASPSNASLLSRYKAKSYEQLIPLLSQPKLVEDGFTERDLALGILVAFHEFDLERAMGSGHQHLQKRMISFDDGKNKVIVFPNLSKVQIENILSFVKTEKWPLKPKGIFQLLKQSKKGDSLYEAFYLTPEFASMETLFKGQGIKKDELLQMIIEGSWGQLSTFHEKQKTFVDVSEENRQKILLSYINENSAAAAFIFLKTDFDFASKRLSDPTVLSILRLLKNSPQFIKFLSTISASARGDSVKTYAQEQYKEMTGRSFEPLVSRETIAIKPQVIEKVMTFPKEPPPKIAVVTTPPPTPKKSLLYIVQDGDSLWKISKRFKVPMEDIRALNGLKNDNLKPGSPLKIPTQGR